MKIVADHLVPQSEGGHFELENLVTCCNQCNAGKGNFLIAEPSLSLIKNLMIQNNERFRELEKLDQYYQLEKLLGPRMYHKLVTLRYKKKEYIVDEWFWHNMIALIDPKTRKRTEIRHFDYELRDHKKDVYTEYDSCTNRKAYDVKPGTDLSQFDERGCGCGKCTNPELLILEKKLEARGLTSRDISGYWRTDKQVTSRRHPWD